MIAIYLSASEYVKWAIAYDYPNQEIVALSNFNQSYDFFCLMSDIDTKQLTIIRISYLSGSLVSTYPLSDG